VERVNVTSQGCQAAVYPLFHVEQEEGCGFTLLNNEAGMLVAGEGRGLTLLNKEAGMIVAGEGRGFTLLNKEAGMLVAGVAVGEMILDKVTVRGRQSPLSSKDFASG
jgi:hypothetical protein